MFNQESIYFSVAKDYLAGVRDRVAQTVETNRQLEIELNILSEIIGSMNTKSYKNLDATLMVRKKSWDSLVPSNLSFSVRSQIIKRTFSKGSASSTVNNLQTTKEYRTKSNRNSLVLNDPPRIYTKKLSSATTSNLVGRVNTKKNRRNSNISYSEYVRRTSGYLADENLSETSEGSNFFANTE